jgi:hypothetical protein
VRKAFHETSRSRIPAYQNPRVAEYFFAAAGQFRKNRYVTAAGGKNRIKKLVSAHRPAARPRIVNHS